MQSKDPYSYDVRRRHDEVGGWPILRALCERHALSEAEGWNYKCGQREILTPDAGLACDSSRPRQEREGPTSVGQAVHCGKTKQQKLSRHDQIIPTSVILSAAG